MTITKVNRRILIAELAKYVPKLINLSLEAKFLKITWCRVDYTQKHDQMDSYARANRDLYVAVRPMYCHDSHSQLCVTISQLAYNP